MIKTESPWREKCLQLQASCEEFQGQIFHMRAALIVAATALEEHAIPSPFVPDSRNVLNTAIERVKEFV